MSYVVRSNGFHGLGSTARGLPQGIFDGFGASPVSFTDGIAAASSALAQLNVVASVLQKAATDTQIEELARQIVRFATVAGPAGLAKAAETKSLEKLLQLQTATRNMYAMAGGELLDAVVERFLTLNIMSPKATEDVKELIRTAKVPGAVEGIPFVAAAILGLGTLVSLAYVARSFR